MASRKLGSPTEEFTYFASLVDERLAALAARSREVDREDIKTLIGMELAEYRTTDPSLILTKQYLLSERELAAQCAHLSTASDPHEEFTQLVDTYGILNTLHITGGLDVRRAHACEILLPELIMARIEGQLSTRATS